LTDTELSMNRLLKSRRKCDYIYLMLSLVPIGYTITYKALAELVSSSPRAIGACMKYNRDIIVIPCHRVVSVKGIGGFSLGVEFKQKLLRLENTNKKINSAEEYWKIIEQEGLIVYTNNL